MMFYPTSTNRFNYRKAIPVFVALAVLAVSGLISPASAQLPGEDSSIQLSFIMAPVEMPNGGKEMRAISSIWIVKNAEDVPTFCQKAPKVRETLLAFLYKYPPRLGKDRRIEVEGIGPRVVPHINRALGKVMVTDGELIEGAKRLAKGAMSRLPFAHSQGCGRVLEEYEERMNKLLGNTKE